MAFPVIPHFPRGWEIVEFVQSEKHPRDAIVLCRRDVVHRYDCNFVVWWANMIEGGCHVGAYKEDMESTRVEFALRVERMN